MLPTNPLLNHQAYNTNLPRRKLMFSPKLKQVHPPYSDLNQTNPWRFLHQVANYIDFGPSHNESHNRTSSSTYAVLGMSFKSKS